MTIELIIENGSIVAGANSYAAVSDADTYFANRNNQIWAELDPTLIKPSCLIQAWDYMLQSYRTKWQGFRVSILQTGDWPRFEVMNYGAPGQYGPAPYYYPPTVVPQEIVNAQIELALRASQSPLTPDIDPITASVQLGTLKIVYDNDYAPIVTFRAVDLLLNPFFKNFGLSTGIGRL